MKVRCRSCRVYVPKSEAIKAGLSHYCSEECRKAIHPKKRSNKNPMPLGLRDKILLRDGRACRWCGKSGEYLEVHHIHYRSEGKRGKHEASNLITLCTDHHKEAHSNKRHWQPVLEEVVRLTHIEFCTVPEVERRLKDCDNKHSLIRSQPETQ